MSLFVSYQVIDTPLTPRAALKRWQSWKLMPIEDEARRMMMILALVAIVVVGLKAAVAPQAVADEPLPEIVQIEQESMAASVPLTSSAGPELSPVFSQEVRQWQPQILAWAGQHQLDPDIVATIMQIESCGDPEAVSSAGAQGLFQVMPFHFEAGDQMRDPDTNAGKGLAYYAWQLQQTEGDIFLAFAGYNGGTAAVLSGWDGWAHETQRYYTWSKGIYEDAKAGLQTSPTLQRWMSAGGASLCQQAAEQLGM